MAKEKDLHSRILELSRHLDELKTQSSGAPDKVKEALSTALDEISISLEELSAAEEELYRQNEELVEANRNLRRQAALIDLSPDSIFVRKLDGMITFWSHGAELQYGWKKPEAIGQQTHTLLKTQFPQPVEQINQQLQKTGRWSGELIHHTKDGRQVIMQSWWLAQFDNQGNLSEVMESNVDITKLNRTLRALSNSNQVLMHAVDESEYLQEVCRIIVEDCGHAMVWIGYAEEDESKSVHPVAYSGFEEGYLETLKITWADTERGRGPTGTAIRTGKVCMCRNMLDDPNFRPWRDQAIKRGYASSIVLPLVSDRKAFGAITIYSRQPDPFSEDEAKLLTELAEDLAYGIASLRLRRSHILAGEALRLSEERYRSLFNGMTEGFALHEIICDDAGKPCDYRFLDINPAFEQLTGLQREKILGKTINEVLPGEDPYWIDAYGSVALTGQPVHFDNYSIALDKHYDVFAYRPTQGQFAVIFRDITDRKRAEEALRRNNGRLEILSETSSRLLSSSKPQEIVDDLCRKVMEFLDCQAFFNYLVDEGKGCLHLNAYAGIPEKAARQIEWLEHGMAICGSVARGGSRIIAENIPETSDPRTDLVRSFGIKAYACHPLIAQGKVIGTLSFGTCSRTRFSDEDLAMMKAVADQAAIAMDRIRFEEALQKARDELEQRVTERTIELSQAKEDLEVMNEELSVELSEHEKLEDDLIKAKESAEAAAQTKAAFMANMSHELRTPMNAVIGMTSLLLEEDLTPEQREFVEIIRSSGDALLILINDVLDFSKMEKDMTELEYQHFDLRKCVEDALDLIAPKAAKKGLDLAYSIDGHTPESLTGDPARLRQVLTNLLDNAVKFTDKGAIELSVLGKPLDPDKYEIRFDTRDTGIGISEESLNKLFQAFSQVDESYTRRYEGTGLGLAISKKLVELMGGKIWVDSALGEGSTFHFTIIAKGEMSNEQKLLSKVQPDLKGKQVLIIDGDKLSRRILGRQVHSWGMVPVMTSSNEEALKWARGDDVFDLAIVDSRLPGLIKPSLAEEIRINKRNLPLIVLSPAGHRPEVEGVIHQTKPIKPLQLYDALVKSLAQKQIEKLQVNGGEEAFQSPLRILLAEDNVSNQKVILEMLRKLGYRADVVANGLEAIQSLDRQQYDLILMDVKMPVMSGLEATKEIRKLWAKGPRIVAITAYALYGDREKCLEAGMDDYISKPVQMNDLVKVLSKYLPSKSKS